MNCPLCLNAQSNPFASIESATNKIADKIIEEFYECPQCHLIYKDENHLLDNLEERSRYENHNNDENDPGYRQFLLRAINPLTNYIKQADNGLDFGCGPGPTTSKIMNEMGYQVIDYDPYFKPIELNTSFDFIISTEVFEHLNSPRKELKLIKKLLKPNAYLCIMTQLYSETIDFQNWWYKNDPTHIVFYTQETMEWIANHYHLEIVHSKKNVMIFRNES